MMRCFTERLGFSFVGGFLLLLYNCALEEQYTHGVLSWMMGMFPIAHSVYRMKT